MVKVEPTSGVLCTVMVPPMRSTSAWVMYSPSPVPPKRRVVEASPCPKARKRRACTSGVMPMPLSATRTTKCAGPPSAASTRSATCPRRVARPLLNLMAFPTRLYSTCRTRMASQATRAGSSGAMNSARSTSLATATGVSVAHTSSTRGRRSWSPTSKVRWPASILDTSRMSSMTARSPFPDCWMVRTASRSRSGRSAAARISAMPMTPLSGVRISWLIMARKVDLARLAASASSTARASSRVRAATSSSRCALYASSSRVVRTTSVKSTQAKITSRPTRVMKGVM